jgi:MinD superfamily P-loop ATPase
MIVAIASGKGGTGKTTVAVNLALAQSRNEQLQLLDCDVEEPNSHIFLKPVFDAPEKAFIPVPDVDDEKCNYCGRCKEVCAFNAIAVIKENVLVFPELCHGCGGCAYFCPEDAITEDPRPIGTVESATLNGLKFIHGRLNPGEAMSPPLIGAVKEKIDPQKDAIIDAPPGTSCPVVTAVKGSDFCLLVTEPTPFGLNDLSLAVEMLRKLDIPFGVLINRSDSGNNCVSDYCSKEGIPVLMSFPWDIELAKLYAKGEPIVPHSADWSKRFEELWTRIADAAGAEGEKTKEERS